MNNAVGEVQTDSGLQIKSGPTTVEADERKEQGVFSGREQCWKPAASNVLGLTGTRGEELTVRFFSIMHSAAANAVA